MQSIGPVPRFGDRRRARIGLLGGSFNPAHEGHRHVAEQARRRLGLDQVWLLVSPGNPLKPARGMAPFATRMRGAASVADGRRVVATGIERTFGTRYTVDTVRALRRRFPRASFVWLMGADILTQLPRWRRFRDMIDMVPLAVLPRPGYTLPALAGQAARRMRHARLPTRAASRLVATKPPAWSFIPGPLHAASATAIRAARKEPRHRPQAPLRHGAAGTAATANARATPHDRPNGVPRQPKHDAGSPAHRGGSRRANARHAAQEDGRRGPALTP